MVDARPKQESWTDKQTNQKRSKIVFVIESFQFLGGRDDAKPASKIDKSDLPPGTKAAATDDTEPPF
jgi:single-stranded DNA-binding protein